MKIINALVALTAFLSVVSLFAGEGNDASMAEVMPDIKGEVPPPEDNANVAESRSADSQKELEEKGKNCFWTPIQIIVTDDYIFLKDVDNVCPMCMNFYSFEPNYSDVYGMLVGGTASTENLTGLALGEMMAFKRLRGISFNLVSGRYAYLYGIGLSGLSNEVGDDTYGLLISPMNLMDGSDVYGGSFGLITSGVIPMSFFGVDTYAGSENIYGFSIGGIWSGARKDMWGISMGTNCVSEKLYGISLGARVGAQKIHGIVFGLLANQHILYGFSFAGIGVAASKKSILKSEKTDGYTVNGAQVCALLAIAESVCGIQLAPINACGKLRGIQIGLLNFADENWLPFSIGINFGWSSAK